MDPVTTTSWQRVRIHSEYFSNSIVFSKAPTPPHRVTGSREELHCLQRHLELTTGPMSGRKEWRHPATVPRGGCGAADDGAAGERLLQDARVLVKASSE